MQLSLSHVLASLVLARVWLAVQTGVHLNFPGTDAGVAAVAAPACGGQKHNVL